MHEMTVRIINALSERGLDYDYEEAEADDELDIIRIECRFDKSLKYSAYVNERSISVEVYDFIDVSEFDDERALFGAVFGNYGGLFFKMYFDDAVSRSINLQYEITCKIHNPEEILIGVIDYFEENAVEFRDRIISHIDGSSGKFDEWRF